MDAYKIKFAMNLCNLGKEMQHINVRILNLGYQHNVLYKELLGKRNQIMHEFVKENYSSMSPPYSSYLIESELSEENDGDNQPLTFIIFYNFK